MAKQAAASKKPTAKPATRTAKKGAVVTSKTPVRAARASAETVTPVNTKSVSFAARFNRALTPQALVAEALGTFILAVVALTATAVLAPLYIGFTLLVLVLVIGGISGAHANPAVTFGLWVARRFPGFALPFYWIAQVIGALAAVLAMAAFTGRGLELTLNSFLSFNWGVFAIEVIGAAIFLFGLTAANSRTGLTLTGRAFGIGLSLFVALTVSAGLYTSLGSSVDRAKIQSIEDVPRLLRLDGAVLNPAIAIGAKEKSDSQLQGTGETGTGASDSRLTLGETIVGTLVGAAIGASLYRLLARREEA